MWNASYWSRRFFAPRYWTKTGETVPFSVFWATNSNRTIGLTVEPK